MTTFHSVRFVILTVFGLFFSLAPITAEAADGDFIDAGWVIYDPHPSPPWNPLRDTPEQACKDSWVPGGVYNGANFEELGVINGSLRCLSPSVLQPFVIYSCGFETIHHPSGEIWYGMDVGIDQEVGVEICGTIPLFCALPELDPETEASNFNDPGLSQNPSDWNSPKDSRFSLGRSHSSAGKYSSRSSLGDRHSSFAGVWSDRFAASVNSASFPAFIYDSGDGQRLGFEDFPSATPVDGGFPYRLSMGTPAEGDRAKIEDGRGKTLYFRTDTSNRWPLEEIVWSDGYRIQITRDTDDRIEEVFDNRGQLARYTWTDTPAPDATATVVSSIEVDSNYDGVTFAPEARVEYTYAPNQYNSWSPVLSQVDLVDLTTAQTKLMYAYDYSLENGPKVTAIRDGRLDGGGLPFDARTITYDGSGALQSMQLAGGSNASTISEDGSGNTVVTNAFGLETTYVRTTVDGHSRVSSVDGAATSNCLATSKSLDYTATGSGPEGYVYGRTERNGSETVFARNARGLIETKTEDATGASPRVTSYTWHNDLRLPATRTRPGVLTESWTYSGTGQILTYSQQDLLVPTNAIRTWTYGYTTLASGLSVLTSVDGPGLAANGVNDVTTFEYNADGVLTKTTDPVGLVTEILSLNALGQPTLVRMPNGQEYAFAYDIEGRLLSSTRDPSGDNLTTGFTYDAIGQLTSLTNTRGQTWEYTWDEAKRLTEVEDPEGDVVSYTYDLMGNITRTEASDGVTVSFYDEAAYDELGRLMDRLGANGQDWHFDYDVEDNLTDTTDPLLNVSSNVYDDLNRIAQVTDRDAQVTTLEHNDENQLTSHEDPRLVETGFTYNGFGELIAESSPDRGSMSYTYDVRGLMVSMTDARGVVSNYAYDDAGRLTSRSFPTAPAEDQTFEYDHIPGGGETHGVGAIWKVTDESGSTENLYAANGSLASQTRTVDTAAYEIGYDFDDEGNLLSVTYPSGRTVEYTHNDANEITSVSVEMGATGVEEPDPGPNTLDLSAEASAAQVDLLNGTATGSATGADLTGILNLVGTGFGDELKGTNGANIILGRDGDDVIKGYRGNDVIFGGEGSDNINADQNNDIVYGGPGGDALYGNGGNDEVYGGEGRDTINGGWGVDRVVGGPGDDWLSGGPSSGDVFVFSPGDGADIVYDFDDGSGLIEFRNTGLSYGDLTIVTGASHVTVTYGPGDSIELRNEAGNIDASDFTFIEDGGGSTLQTVADNIAYLPSGPIGTMTFGDGFTLTASYDSSYRLTGLLDSDGVTDLRHVDYGHSTRDNVTSLTDQLDALKNETYGYDAREMLISAAGPYDTITYDYDGVGNRIERSTDDGVTLATALYSYPIGSNRLDAINEPGGGTRTMLYDAAGNTISDDRADGLYTYTYNAANRMASVSKDGVLQGQEYVYNAQGQQVSRTFDDGSGVTTIHAIHDLDGNRIAEYAYDSGTGSSTLIREYLWLNQMPIAVVEGGAVYYIRTDHIGKPVFATDATGAKVWQVDYLPFGGVLASSGPNPDLRFPGQWFQAESGLHQNWMRDYDPTTGRYIQADPLGLVDGASVFNYALQNPNRYVDPYGLDSSIPLYNPPPDGMAGQGGWKWQPDPNNSRGGTWQGQTCNKCSASWDEPGRHWDVDDGSGNRQRYNWRGAPITADEAHRPHKLTPKYPPLMGPMTGVAMRCMGALGTFFLYWDYVKQREQAWGRCYAAGLCT